MIYINLLKKTIILSHIKLIYYYLANLKIQQEKHSNITQQSLKNKIASFNHSQQYFALPRLEDINKDSIMSKYCFDKQLELIKFNSLSNCIDYIARRINLTCIIFRISTENSMNTIKNFFPFAFTPTPSSHIDNTLNTFQMNTNTSLPDKYYASLFTSDQNFLQSFSELIRSVPKASSAFALVKLFTVIFKTLREKEYERDTLELLEDLQIPLMSEQQQKENSWIGQVSIAIKSYLARLPSMEDVFKRALSFRKTKADQSYQVNLSDLYRLLNLFGLLFPGLTISLNIIGRYYLKTSPYYQEFYKILREEIMLGYDYIEYIVSYFKSEFKKCDSSSIDCFVKTVPQIQLYCDKIEEFMMNKYFKGRAPNRKIYFKEEEINQILYHLKSLENKSTKSEEIIHTSDQEDFGEFQH